MYPEEIEAPAGTRVYVEGIPFTLKEPTIILGLRENWEMAQRFMREDYGRVG